MTLAKRVLMISGSLLVSALLFSLILPNRAHALVAALVQVTNTAENPAVTEDVSRSASQIVNLNCINQPLLICTQIPANGQYTVPAGKSLVITSVDIFAPVPENVFLETIDSSGRVLYLWEYIEINGQIHYSYPTGIVWGPGSQVIVSAPTTFTSTNVYLSGYLTSN